MKPVRYVQIHQIVSEEKLKSIFFTMGVALQECLEEAVIQKKIGKAIFYDKDGFALETFYLENGIIVQQLGAL